MSDIITTLTDRHYTLQPGEHILISQSELRELITYTNDAYGTKASDMRLPNGCRGMFMGRYIFVKYEPMEDATC